MLTAFQRDVAKLFFSLPEAGGFALAGGSALAARGDVPRGTRDLDLFTPDEASVRLAAEAFTHAAKSRGWDILTVRSFPVFVHLRVSHGDDSVEVEIARDYRWRPAEETEVGPTLSSEELAADKMLALFGRALPRDFVDVYFLARKHGIDNLLRWAPEKDAGFDPYVLAVSIGTMARHPRVAFPVDEPTFLAMQQFFDDLRTELMRRAIGPAE